VVEIGRAIRHHLNYDYAEPLRADLSRSTGAYECPVYVDSGRLCHQFAEQRHLPLGAIRACGPERLSSHRALGAKARLDESRGKSVVALPSMPIWSTRALFPGTLRWAIVGAGICGLAHALAAARRGKRVVVVDRDRQANGASIRNFGFITITGQQAGECRRRARRSREVWAEVADAAGIPCCSAGSL
jgi:hypothetical protein